MLTVREASKILGLDERTLSNKKYEKYKTRLSRNRVFFDLQQYRKDKYRDEEFLEKVKLFVEWCRHEKDIPYRALAKIAGCSYSAISTHDFRFKIALNLARNVEKKLIREFDRFYGWI